MQKIVPHLWFDKEAVEAAEFYATVFPDSKVTFKNEIKGTPSGDTAIVGFQVMGFNFMAISAGPLFKINPSISFHAKCKTVEEVNDIWSKLSPGGTVMMELGEYPFSKRYGWIQDRFGVSWQVIYTEGEFTQRVTPVMMFTNAVCGKTEEAINFYASLFSNSKAQVLSRYNAGEEPDKEGAVRYSQLILEGQEFGAMDSARPHKFDFNEGISFMVNCKDQTEIDFLWEKLSAVPASEQCGWLKDKYGVSWQIIPENMGALTGKNPSKTMPVMLKMKKIVIADLEKAGE
jgi:predicted 3-demethylubiquinone-9 3-methyltransferase (glyoxalase superfamily)